MKALFLITALLFSLNATAESSSRSSSISSGDIIDFINAERKVLRGRHQVDLSSKFKKEDSVFAYRYGNTKKVLNLNSISLSGEDLSRTSFNMASMIKADLSEANLEHSDFVYVDFTSANLRGANFKNADLSSVVFDSTKLKGANFEGANLFGAKFYKISDISDEELNSLKKRSRSYIQLQREELPDYYKFD